MRYLMLFKNNGPDERNPTICPMYGILGRTTGGSRGSTLISRSLENTSTTANTSPIAAKVVGDIAILVALFLLQTSNGYGTTKETREKKGGVVVAL